MDIVSKLKENMCNKFEIAECLNSANPIVRYTAIKCIVNNKMSDKIIIDKLFSLSSSDHKMSGYYKVGHFAMAALIKLGIEENRVFAANLDDFEKSTAIKLSKML